jgi:serine/threonine protein kinase
MAVTPSNLLLDKPFRSLAPPPPSNPLEALWRSFQAAWGQVSNAAANPDPGVTAAAAAAAAAASTSGSGGNGGDSYSEASLSRAAVKLCDFGRALPLDRLGEPQGREPLMIFASPGYRPPEVGRPPACLRGAAVKGMGV